MNVERARELLLSLKHVVETAQWGGLVFWVGDKAVGGKMFVMMNPEPGAGVLLSYAAGEERFHELCEREGLRPAPYMARIFWVAADGWAALGDREWENELRAAHRITLEKLPPRVKATLELPRAELRTLVNARRKALAEKDAAQKARKKAAIPASRRKD